MEAIAEKKIIILYFVSLIKGITWQQLTNLSMQTLYMDYFSFGQCVDELKQDGFLFISEQKAERSLDSNGKPVNRFYLTPSGESILNATKTQLSRPIIKTIHLLVAPFIDPSTPMTFAEYKINRTGHITVHLNIKEADECIFELSYTVPSMDLAKKICTNFEQHSLELYPQLLTLLTPTTTDNGPPLNEHQSNN